MKKKTSIKSLMWKNIYPLEKKYEKFHVCKNFRIEEKSKYKKLYVVENFWIEENV